MFMDIHRSNLILSTILPLSLVTKERIIKALHHNIAWNFSSSLEIPLQCLYETARTTEKEPHTMRFI